MDSLRVLDTDPVDYLVTPRVLASMIAGPILNVLCFCMGEAEGTGWGGVVLASVPSHTRMHMHFPSHTHTCMHTHAHHTLLSAGIGASVWLADLVYNVPANIIIDSCRRALTDYDVYTSMVKAWVFGTIVSVVSGPPHGGPVV
jgi:ABC-type transporter Mla maintaining outer membrane lipid asymmetry permease subunit MlaE